MNAKQIYALGYTDLISVVPPGATLTANSKLKPEALGKTPGKRSSAGEWYGYNWQAAGPATLRDVAQWTLDGANTGLRASAFPAVDIDCTDENLVAVIRGLAITMLGDAPERQGRKPKSLLMYRTETPFGRMRLWIDGRKHLVEVLGDGQQYVVAGIHPGTKQPYTWRSPLVEAPDLYEIDAEAAKGFLEAVADAADMLGYSVEHEGNGSLSVDREAVNQTALVGDAAKVAEALALVPNDNEHFPGRDDYLRMGYAIKAALGEPGLPLFIEWAEKWEGNENAACNEHDEIIADWGRMKAPFEVGANYLFETAAQFGYAFAADEFEAIDEPPPLTDGDEDLAAIMYSDAALAQRFLKRHAKEVRFCPLMGGWLIWTGRQWKRDDGLAVQHWAGKIGMAASNEALATIDEKGTAHKVATRCASYNVKVATVKYASDHPAIAARAEQFDASKTLLNTPGGVVDLDTGLMIPHQAAHLMTKLTAAAPAPGRPEAWLAFLDEATGGDKALQAYLQRLAGYCLTGQTSEQILAFFYGKGGNGKGTFLNTLADVWKDYGKTTPMATFTASSIDQHPTAIADLAGARLVQAHEVDASRRWDEAKIKTLTGQDRVKARFMQKDFFEYDPQFKLLFSGNTRPNLNTMDDAIKRRFHLVPFLLTPKRVDQQLPAKLKKEYGQILQWAIDGALEWKRIGLAAPRAVVEATAEYFDDEDPHGNWLRERTAAAADAVFINSHSLYEDWREWCGARGEFCGSEKRFVQTLQGRGLNRKKQGGTGLRGFVGLRLTETGGSEFHAS